MSKNKNSGSRGKPKALPLPVSVPKWPFLSADIIFIGLGYWISTLIQGEPQPWQIISILVCAILGAAFAVAPFYFEYKAESKAVEIAQLTSVTKEINKMELVASQITDASENWTAAQDASRQTAKLAEEIAAGIAETVKTHDTFMESDWAHTLVGLLDLVYRLERSAVASGKEDFIKTMGQFQGQCREVSRRVGLVAFEAESGAVFNPDEHALPDGEPISENASVSETRLPGFRLQGKLVRKPFVAIS